MPIAPPKIILAASFLSLTAPLFWSGLSGSEKAVQSYYVTQPATQKDTPNIVSADQANALGYGFVRRDIDTASPSQSIHQMASPYVYSHTKPVMVQ